MAYHSPDSCHWLNYLGNRLGNKEKAKSDPRARITAPEVRLSSCLQAPSLKRGSLHICTGRRDIDLFPASVDACFALLQNFNSPPHSASMDSLRNYLVWANQCRQPKADQAQLTGTYASCCSIDSASNSFPSLSRWSIYRTPSRCSISCSSA